MGTTRVYSRYSEFTGQKVKWVEGLVTFKAAKLTEQSMIVNCNFHCLRELKVTETV